MSTISIRLKKEEEQLLREYVAMHNMSLSEFVRTSILDVIEDNLKLDEQLILNAYKNSHNEKEYSLEEAWKELGL